MNTTNNNIVKEQIEEYYNSIKLNQKITWVNIRHRKILKNLKKNGLKRNSCVLEIGCGVGALSSIILQYISNGFYVGVDISKESIEIAKNYFSKYTNASFIVNDMTTFQHNKKFDIVVLPDVLEHIPFQQHQKLFELLNQVTTVKSKIIINIPNPYFINWLRNNHPEKLQIIDQALCLNELFNNSFQSGFKINSITPYSIHYNNPEYIYIVLTKKDFEITEYRLKGKIILAFENYLSKIFL